jgi:uncharacterized protein (TIGR00369 family)
VGEQALVLWAEALSGVARAGLGSAPGTGERERFDDVLKIAAQMRALAEMRVASDLRVDVAGDDDGADEDIRIIEATGDRVEVQLTVGPRVHQPFGILHGGISVLLAESAASIGASIAAGPDHRVVGVEINANHLRPMRQGVLTAVATPVRKGRRIHVWGIELADDSGQLICVSRCTLAVIEQPRE